MGEVWDFWQDGEHSPAENMATDEVLLNTAATRGRPLLRFYGWSEKAVSLGYVQKITAAPEGYAVVRRPTGGGVVYHDFDFTYSIVFPSNHWLNGLDRMRSYDVVNRSVQAGLQQLDLQASLSQQEIASEVDRGTMVCFTNPTRYDLLLDGVKIAGSAQRRTQAGVLHQGSIHFGGPLPVEKAKLGEALLAGFRQVMEVQFVTFDGIGGLGAMIEECVATKYGTAAWNERR